MYYDLCVRSDSLWSIKALLLFPHISYASPSKYQGANKRYFYKCIVNVNVIYTNENLSQGEDMTVLGLEKGTDCGPSAAELWLSRANNAKKGMTIGSCHICSY